MAAARWCCGGITRHRQEPVVREVAAMAAGRGVEVFTAFCESHASEIPFHVVARLLRAATGVSDLDDRPPATAFATGFPTPTPRICCS